MALLDHSIFAFLPEESSTFETLQLLATVCEGMQSAMQVYTNLGRDSHCRRRSFVKHSSYFMGAISIFTFMAILQHVL